MFGWCFPVNFVKFLRTHFYRTPLLAASVTPNIERRYNNTVRIQTKIYKKKAEVLGEEAVARYEKPKLEDQGKICGMYLEEVTGHENCKTKKNKLNNKIKTVCYKCKHAVCTKKHTVIIRQKCHEEIT